MTPDQGIAIKVNDVVQIGPEASSPEFAYCMLIVASTAEWGVNGFVQGWGQDGKTGGQAYYRAKWLEIEFVGRASWGVGL